MRFSLAVLAFPVFTAHLAAAGAEPAGRVRFNRDVRPILSDKCFFCHGPDSKKRKADLRLDMIEDAVKDGHIVPGDPGRSTVMERVLSLDPEEQMPPPDSKLGALTPAEADVLRRWIAQGAEHEAHWSFIPVTQENGAGSIDAIVSAGLKTRGLALQPEAAPETLIRRLSFDITGLPPSEEEVRGFVRAFAGDGDIAGRENARAPSQRSEAALGALVDRLLASSAYGERMAVDWLDLARYADSYGFQVDRDREVWQWRDWVVRAFNQNMPFDQFVTWQLAGDLLPGATDEQIMATAFNRLHQQESEGGSVEEEYRVEYVVDRVQTFATAFLGLTFECARCHDHKYDPVTQRDFYGLFSMFQNIDEAGLYSFFTPSQPTPAMMMLDAPGKDKMTALQARIVALEQKLPRRVSGKPDLSRGEIAHFTFDELKGGKLADARNADAKAAATLKGENVLKPGRTGQAVLFTGDDPVVTPVGNFNRHDPFSVALWLKTPDLKERAVVFHRSRAWTDAASRGYELLIEEGRPKWSLIHFWPGNAISIRAKDALPPGEWVHVVVTNDGSSRAEGLRMYVNGRAAPVEIVRDSLTRNITGGGGDTISLGERFRDRGFKGGMIDDLRVFDRDVSRPFEPATEPLLAELHAARGELTRFVTEAPEIMVMREMQRPKTAYVLARGEYDKRGEAVGPGTPVALPALPKGAPRNRLGLAQWLAAPNHPLMARVTVNRLWQSLFGRGLVKTAEDFGSQGEKPLYPELLDHLASRLIHGGFDLKAMIKEIVTSKVYRQRSIADATTMADDPENQWLARGPRFRLPAEMIRDNALAAAGLLNLRMGGKPVYPYETTEGFKPAGPSAGDDVYRRSLYTHWRRTSPPPAMVTFDAPRRGVCVAKRERTDSPLQALILLNGEQYVEAARVLGERLHSEAKGDCAKMIRTGFMRCLSREPDAREMEILSRLFQEQLAHFKSAPSDAGALLAVGRAPRNAAVPLPEAAAATVLAQALMNHDECVVKR